MERSRSRIRSRRARAGRPRGAPRRASTRAAVSGPWRDPTLLTPDPFPVTPNRPRWRTPRLLGAAVVTAAWGCSVFGGIRNEPLTAGRARTFAVHLQQVLDGTRRTADSLGLRIAEYYAPDAGSWGLILRPHDSMAGDRKVTIRVSAVTSWDQSETVVRVLAQPAAPRDSTSAADWARRIFAGIERELRAQRKAVRGGGAGAAPRRGGSRAGESRTDRRERES